MSTPHAPRHQYDCGRCKFSWCCGPLCACGLRPRALGLAPTPYGRGVEVTMAQSRWRNTKGFGQK